MIRFPTASRTSSWRIWSASSFVGARTSARTPPLDFSLVFARDTDDNIGMAKAAVFPEPVGALAKTSRPASRAGMACIWIGVGSFQFDCSIFVRRAAFTDGSIFIDKKVGHGGGGSVPFTLILSWFRNACTSSSLEKVILGSNDKLWSTLCLLAENGDDLFFCVPERAASKSMPPDGTTSKR
jgi:hypothetical protein